MSHHRIESFVNAELCHRTPKNPKIRLYMNFIKKYKKSKIFKTGQFRIKMAHLKPKSRIFWIFCFQNFFHKISKIWSKKLKIVANDLAPIITLNDQVSHCRSTSDPLKNSSTSGRVGTFTLYQQRDQTVNYQLDQQHHNIKPVVFFLET